MLFREKTLSPCKRICILDENKRLCKTCFRTISEISNCGTLFATPTAAEGAFVAQIYRVEHFQHNIEHKKLLKGGRNADPFVVAKAKVAGASVVTTEKRKPNGAKDI